MVGAAEENGGRSVELMMTHRRLADVTDPEHELELAVPP